jgi:hypothetical protein
MVGLVSTCGRELLWGWWWPIGLMVNYMIFTVSIRNILDTTTYFHSFESSRVENGLQKPKHITVFS